MSTMTVFRPDIICFTYTNNSNIVDLPSRCLFSDFMFHNYMLKNNLFCTLFLSHVVVLDTWRCSWHMSLFLTHFIVLDTFHCSWHMALFLTHGVVLDTWRCSWHVSFSWNKSYTPSPEYNSQMFKGQSCDLSMNPFCEDGKQIHNDLKHHQFHVAVHMCFTY